MIQDPSEPGIFGAMNQGFYNSSGSEYVFFWGSDDWASSSNMLSDVVNFLDECRLRKYMPDLLICTGRYLNEASGLLSRPSYFHPFGLFNQRRYRNALRFGSTPPHQGTIFGPRVRKLIPRYSLDFRLAADLDYFLQLSKFADLRVQSHNLEIVHMSDGGISGKQTLRLYGLHIGVPLDLPGLFLSFRDIFAV